MSADLMELFYTTINVKAKTALSGTLNGDLLPVELGAQGDFPWFWADANGNFNANTYDYISRRVTSGQHGGIALQDFFADAYSNALTDLTFVLSQSDHQLLGATQLKASAQATTLVTNYQTQYGAITQDQLTAAAEVLGYTPDKVSYVIGYVVAYIWSGKSQAKAPALTFVQLAAARNFNQLLPNSPPSAQTILPLVSTYLSVTNAVLSLEDASSNALWIKNQLVNNTQNPSTDNGAVTTIDNNGVKAVRPGYVINSPVAEILNSLQTDSKFTVSMTTSRTDANSLQVDINGQIATVVPLSFLSIGVEGGASYSLFQANGSGESASVEMTFSGLTVVPLDRAQWQQDSTGAGTKGWFYAKPLAGAAGNPISNTPTTGWSFSPVPPYDFSPHGDFGWLTALVISNYPSIKITYSEGNYADFSKTFSQNFSASVKLFGIPLGNASESTFSGTTSTQSSDGSFSIEILPPQQGTNVATLDQRAYVLGAQTGNAGATVSLARQNLAVSPSDTVQIRLGAVTFRNQTGAQVEVYSMAQGRTTFTPLTPGQQSAALNGSLLHIDVLRGNVRYTYPLFDFLPNGLLVQAESPYQLQQVLDTNRRLLLVISDNHGATVGTFRPAGALAV